MTQFACNKFVIA